MTDDVPGRSSGDLRADVRDRLDGMHGAHDGVAAGSDTVMGTMHAVEAIPNVCPEISRAAARDIVGHAG